MIQASRTSPLSVGVVHEWFDTYSGSERVVEQILQVFPTADLYALVDFLPEQHRSMLGGRTVATSFLQRMPLSRRKFRAYLPLMPLAIEQFDLSSHNVIISSNHAVAKGVITRGDQLHICYVHTPIRYAWELQHQYLQESRLHRGVRTILVRALLHYLRMWDCLAAVRVNVYVANSQFIADRVRKTYGREAQVVYPPVNVDAFPLRRVKQDYYVTASRLVPYKKVDIVVEAFRKMPDKRLVVIGHGPMHKQLASNVPSNVQLLGHQPHAVLVEHLQNAQAFLFAAEEDFGILPVEAQACGTPVITYGRGGATETVRSGVTGLFFEEQNADSLIAAIETFEANREGFDPQAIRANAERFSPARFRYELAELVKREWDHFRSRELLASSQAALNVARVLGGQSIPSST